MSEFEQWLGRQISVTDTLEPGRSNALDIALGGTGELAVGDALPLLDHWLFFWDVKPPSGLGYDGHPAKGGFLPPVPLPRRMWAGGRLTFHRPLILGTTVKKTSTILSITQKSGKSGPLVFITVGHNFQDQDGLALSEEQDLVYREGATMMQAAPEPQPAAAAPWSDTINPDPVLLFRYSALTMNGHRIHYDRRYAREEEFYPGLVVHGPLQAKLLMRLALEHAHGDVIKFDFRGQSPAYDGAPLHICGEPTSEGARLWTQQGAAKNMVANVHLEAS